MSNKGKAFGTSDLPRATQQRIANKQVSDEERAKISAYLDAQTTRYKIVAKMSDGTPLIAEELDERSMRHHASVDYGNGIDSAVLATLRGLMQLSGEQRAAVLVAFDKKGGLIMPFKKA